MKDQIIDWKKVIGTFYLKYTVSLIFVLSFECNPINQYNEMQTAFKVCRLFKSYSESIKRSDLGIQDPEEGSWFEDVWLKMCIVFINLEKFESFWTNQVSISKCIPIKHPS